MRSQAPVTTGTPHPPDSAREDCLVVEINGRDAVVHLLTKWGGERSVTVQTHPGLGLSKITFVDPATAAQVARSCPPNLAQTAAGPQGIDAVLAALRHHLAGAFGGWVPSMGKNRYVQGVRPNQTIDVGGAGDATPDQTIDVGTKNAQGLVAVGQPPPRRRRAGGPYVTVGILDTELVRHPFFEARLDPRGQARHMTPTRVEDGWHGTFVAGIVHQVAPRAALFGQPAGRAAAFLESWAVACAMADLAALGLPILNVSLACRTVDNLAPLIFLAAKAALGRRTLVVAAAGNYADRKGSHVSQPVWPAALDGVVAVGSVHKPRPSDPWEVSAYSPKLPWVDVYAPGDNVVSAHLVGPRGASYAKGSGTSFAAAAVSGAIAATMRDDSPWTALDRLIARSPSPDLPIVLP